MAAMSNFLEEKLLQHLFNHKAYTGPSKVFLALFENDPGEYGTGNELFGDGYDRTQFNMDVPSNGQVANKNDIVFPKATKDWKPITHVAIYDSKSFGNMLFYGELDTPSTIVSGDSFVVPAGELAVALG